MERVPLEHQIKTLGLPFLHPITHYVKLLTASSKYYSHDYEIDRACRMYEGERERSTGVSSKPILDVLGLDGYVIVQ
jgi:hypothetical protein